MAETKLEIGPISQISNPRVFFKDQTEFSVEKKKLKFPNATICKISSQSNDFLDQVIAFLNIGFKVSPTSAKMFNDETKQFFQFMQVEPKEDQ